MASDRFERFEYRNDDFPFYDGSPVRISGPQWGFVMAAVVLGFLALIAPVPFFATELGQFVPAVLFFAIPLFALATVARGHWTAIFRRVGVRDVLWMVAFALLNILASVVVGMIVVKLFGATANPSIGTLAEESSTQRVLFFLKTIPQLFGEEVLTILPFLALLTLGVNRLGLSRKTAILFAWLLSAILFGMAHLPTYDWNWVQCVVVIGVARLVLTLPYIKTKNIWVSTGAHVLNDWIIFGTSLLGASRVAG